MKKKLVLLFKRFNISLYTYLFRKIWQWLLSVLAWTYRRPQKPAKVLLMGLGKSGTSIAAYRIYEGLSSPKKMYFEPIAFDREYMVKNNRHTRAIVNSRWNLVAKCLVSSQKNFNWEKIVDYARNYNRRIWIARDPRDRLLSDFFYATYWKKVPAGREREFEAFFRHRLQKVREKELNPDAVSFKDLHPNLQTLEDSLRFFCDFQIKSIAHSSEDAWFVLRYEDFVDGNIEMLNDYLGFEVDLKAQLPGYLRRVSRTKGHGNWRDWFTSNDVKFFRPLFNDYLRAFGYDAGDWELTENPVLNPQFASHYIEQLYYDKTL